MKSQKALKILSGFGKSLPVTSQTKKHGKVYHQVCLYMYKDKTSETSLKPVPKSWMQWRENLLQEFPQTLIPSFESHQGQLPDIHHVERYGLWCLPITSSAWLELANGQIFANKTYKTSITAKTSKYASKWQCRRYRFWYWFRQWFWLCIWWLWHRVWVVLVAWRTWRLDFSVVIGKIYYH